MSDHESDSTLVWSLAANCRLYEDDPGPRELNVGSATEPRYVPRSEALRDLYARQLVLGVEADPSRIDALADRCRAEIEATHTVWHWIGIMRRRMNGPGRLSNRLRSALEIMDPREREALREVHRCSADLCKRASILVKESESTDDDKARRRLLAGLDHQATADILGFIPGVEENSAQQLVERLKEIEES
jgi:hypothetical protein